MDPYAGKTVILLKDHEESVDQTHTITKLVYLSFLFLLASILGTAHVLSDS